MMNLSLEHQGRELVNVIGLLGECLEIPGTSPATLRLWRRQIFNAREQLAALHAAGLSPTFLAPGVLTQRDSGRGTSGRPTLRSAGNV